MTNFTSGPWQQSWDYKRLSSYSPQVVAYATGPQHVSKGIAIDDEERILQPSKEAMEKVYADARLIAAAPDLRDALRNLRTLFLSLVDINAAYFGPREYACLRETDLALAKTE
jgi:hypothetical protein